MKALYPTPCICIPLPYETPSMNSCRKWSSRTVCCLLSILCRNARYTPCQMEKPCSDWIICVYNRLKNTLPLCNSGRACKALIFFVLLTSPITFLSSIKTTCRMYPAGFFYFIRYTDRISLLSLLSQPFHRNPYLTSIISITSSSSGVYHTMYMFAAISYS